MTDRIRTLAALLKKLHAGEPVVNVYQEMAAQFDGISANELAKAEELLASSGVPIAEIQRLSTEHTAVVAEQMQDKGYEENGHPLTVFIGENKGFVAFLKQKLQPALQGYKTGETDMAQLQLLADEFAGIFRHYDRKENLFFPYLEQAGITVPPMVMWGVDDVIRNLARMWNDALTQTPPDPKRIELAATRLIQQAVDMVQKENEILVPMLKSTLTEADWILCAQESETYGYAFHQGIEGASLSDARTWLMEKTGDKKQPAPEEEGRISLPSGNFTKEELICMLNTLPTDLTFADKDNIIRYYSEGKGQVFSRTRTIIGRDLLLCHPPQIVPAIRKLIEAFRAGTKEQEIVPMRRGNRLDLVRYYAVRNEEGAFMGTLEVTEEVSDILHLWEEK